MVSLPRFSPWNGTWRTPVSLPLPHKIFFPHAFHIFSTSSYTFDWAGRKWKTCTVFTEEHREEHSCLSEFYLSEISAVSTGRAHCANAALACFDTNICTTHTGMRENKTFVDADFAQFFSFALGNLESTGAHNPVYVILPVGDFRRSLLCYCSTLDTVSSYRITIHANVRAVITFPHELLPGCKMIPFCNTSCFTCHSKMMWVFWLVNKPNVLAPCIFLSLFRWWK